MLVSRTPGIETIGSKYVFKAIPDGDAGYHKKKARLCALECMQKEGIDYMETFSTVVRYDSLRMLLSIIAHENLEIHSFDVSAAFLYEKLDEEIFMEVPQGIDHSELNTGCKDEVCKLDKALYELKQAPRCWNNRFK